MIRRVVLAGALMLLAAGVAPADTLYLKSGAKFEGQVVREDGQSVVFKIRGIGPQTFKRSEIDRIEQGASVFDEYEARRKALAAKDADGWFELGIWCMDQGLRQEGRKALQAAVSADPDHARARRALGYVRVKDRWLDRDQHRRWQEDRQKELEAVLGKVEPGDPFHCREAKVSCRPPRGWAGGETPDGMGQVYSGPTLHGVGLVFGFECANPLDVAIFKAGVAREIRARAGEIRPVREDAPAALGGTMARENVCRYGPKDAEVERHDVWLEREEGLVHAWYEGPAEDQDALRPLFGRILDSFSFAAAAEEAAEGGAGPPFSYDLPGSDWMRGFLEGIEDLGLPEIGTSIELVHHSIQPAVIFVGHEKLEGADPVADREATLSTFEKALDGVRILKETVAVRDVAGTKALCFEYRGSLDGSVPVEGIVATFAKSGRRFTVFAANMGGAMDMKYFRKDVGKLIDSFKVK